ncbi:hypothetical protein BX600DRAFT_460994 [Xylariales sp. PMI_506]|nr:hypothetical protein BX600DRAFT_460994 [Xylariales sp. PMI_506]
MAPPGVDEVFSRVLPHLQRSERSDVDNSIILMTCGLAGTGKTTLAKQTLAHLPGFTRLSIDELIFSSHGLYGVDYPADTALYDRYMEEAGEKYLAQFLALLGRRENIILERSFYAREDRDEFRELVATHGGGARIVFVYLRARDKEALWRRICERSARGKDANSALEITREIFDMYWAGFEEPEGEGEIVIDVT